MCSTRAKEDSNGGDGVRGGHTNTPVRKRMNGRERFCMCADWLFGEMMHRLNVFSASPNNTHTHTRGRY